MNLGLRMFAFIQNRDITIIKKETLRAAKYVCTVCPKGRGGVYVNTPDETQECFCLGCGQLYLVVVTGRRE